VMAQEPIATKVLAFSLMVFNLSSCSFEEIAPSTKATSIGPTPRDFLRTLAYLKSIFWSQSCQWSFRSSVMMMVESSQQVKVNQPMTSFWGDCMRLV